MHEIGHPDKSSYFMPIHKRSHRAKYGRAFRKVRRKGFQVMSYAVQMALGNLNDETVIAVDVFSNPFGEDFFCISADVYCGMRDHTIGQGPIQVGVAHGDYSTTEIADRIDLELTDPDDLVQRERMFAKIRDIGMFHGLSTHETLAAGEKIRVPLKFSVGDAHDLIFWARNKDGNALTTGSVIEFFGKLYGRWQR